MYWVGILLVVMVGALNVAFNYWTREAALGSPTWSIGLFSVQFAIAFLIGCSSLLTLYTLYASGIHLGRAILLMGAVSIVGGTLFGVWLDTTIKLDWSEKVLLASISLFFVYRMLIKKWLEIT